MFSTRRKEREKEVEQDKREKVVGRNDIIINDQGN